MVTQYTHDGLVVPSRYSVNCLFFNTRDFLEFITLALPLFPRSLPPFRLWILINMHYSALIMLLLEVLTAVIGFLEGISLAIIAVSSR